MCLVVEDFNVVLAFVMSEYCEQKLFNLILTEALLPCWLKPLTRYSVPLLSAFCGRLVTRLWLLHKGARGGYHDPRWLALRESVSGGGRHMCG